MVNINKNAQTLTCVQNDVLIGSLLGDGSLSIRKDSVNPRLTIRRQILDLPYLQYQFDIFRNLCRDKAITTGIVYDKRYDKNYEYCNLESRYIPAFKKYHELWYPVDKKIIPPDLRINSLIIAIWACDDGNFSITKNKRLRIVFHTQGFSKEEVIFLRDLLNDRYNIRFKIQNPEENKFIIVGHDHQTRILIKDIDSVFPNSMTRKSSVWRNNFAHFYKDEPKQYGGHKSKGDAYE
jgi:hypothetical protein